MTDQPEDTGASPLASPVRRAIMDSLASARRQVGSRPVTGLTAAELADVLGLHVTTVRFHLDRLLETGLVTAEFTTAFGVGRPRKVYRVRAGPTTDARGPGTTLGLLAGLLTEYFGTDATPEEAGEQWVHEHVPLPDTGTARTTGDWITEVGRLVDVLEEWGYRPELSTSDAGRSCRIALPSCPVLDLARANPAVVCGIHRGVLIGALHAQGEYDVDVSLEPFVGPELCRARLTTRAAFGSLTAEA